MAEGIMGLAPGMGAPAAPQQAPQQPDPRGMQAFMDAAGSMDPAEVEGQLDEALGEVDPALAQQLQAELSAIQLPPEIIAVLIDVVDGLLEEPGQYAQRRMEVIEAGLPADFLPEEFNLEYLSTLRYVLTHLTPQDVEVPVQGFKDGGAVSLKPIAKFLAAQGRGGDTILAHINKSEAAMLKRMGGAGSINPVTGLPEYLKKAFKKAWKGVTKAVKSVGKAIAKVVKPVINVTKKLLANPIVRTLATVGVAVLFPPAAAFGMTAGTVASAAVNYGISTAGISLLAGEKPKDALKQGLMAGALAGGTAYAMGADLTGSTRDLGMGQTSVRDFVGKGVDAINPFSSSTPTVTADTEFAKLTSKGLPANAETYRLATEAAAKANQTTILGMSPSTAITTAATVLPMVAPFLGSPDQPEPGDVPGGGGPTGMELLEGDPGKYGITIGDTSSTYTDPYAGIEDRTPINIGSSDPNAPISMPGTMPPIGAEPSAGFAPVSPTMPTGDQYSDMFAGYDPTKDPMNPLYDPFATTTPPPAPFTGGVDVAQGFARGGIATLQPVQKFARGGLPTPKMKPTKQSPLLQRQLAGMERNRVKASWELGESSSKPKSQAELYREAQASQAAAERTRQRTAAEQRKRIDSTVAAAQRAAQEGRAFEFGPGYASERDLYRQAIESARQSSPTQFMTPAEAEAYVARQRAQNLTAEKAAFEKSQAEAIALANRNATALAEKQRAEKELADFEAYKASILGPGSSTQPITPGAGTTAPTAPGTTAPVAPPIAIPEIGIGANTPSAGPTAPAVPEINIGVPQISAATPVYGPDGTEYASPAAAISAGVFNYSTTPPTPGGIASLPPPSPPEFSIPSFGTPSSGAPSSGIPSFEMSSFQMPEPEPEQGAPVAFANGGIAAMAPYKFKSGSRPIQHFPRRTGPINGPGTGTSDSIPAMLSDGEFVFTAKAVRNMGNGSRLAGAKKMYKMMKMLEGKS